jgi:periplasmic protein TonB
MSMLPVNQPDRRYFVSRAHHRRSEYLLNFMYGLAGSLLLLTIFFRLPMGDEHIVGWYIAPPDERLTLELIDVERAHDVRGGAPISVANEMVDEVQPDEDEGRQPLEPEMRPLNVPTDRFEARGLAVRGATDPFIQGGLGSYYMLIEYPEEARRQGIEGRLVLDFVVDERGRAHDIMVIQSLHALCDSAAVRALRQTRFTPGMRDGEPVAVRMRLPVRFRLLEPQTAFVQ